MLLQFSKILLKMILIVVQKIYFSYLCTRSSLEFSNNIKSSKRQNAERFRIIFIIQPLM